jgi:glycosyltransferase involved in cell wall biosynthesis
LIRVNVCAEGNDWLFGDLKRQFAASCVSGVTVSVSEVALDADAWIFLRAGEAADSPDLSRTVICIHDLYEHDRMYLPGGERAAVRDAGGLALCHPRQREILEEAGVPMDGIRILDRPLGALRIFTPRREIPPAFTIGWVGRAHWRKRLEWVEECAGTAGVVLIGKDLENTAERLKQRGSECVVYPRETLRIEDYPALYHQMDCLLITSCTEAGPLTLFEALACGVPVVSTPVGWAPYFASKAPQFVRLGETPGELMAALDEVRRERQNLFERRGEIASLAETPRLDTWFADVIRLAAACARTRTEAADA